MISVIHFLLYFLLSFALFLLFFFLMIRRPPRSTLFPTRRSSDLGPLVDVQGRVIGINTSGSSRHWQLVDDPVHRRGRDRDRKSTRLNSSHVAISYAVFCLKKKTKHRSLHGPKSG